MPLKTRSLKRRSGSIVSNDISSGIFWMSSKASCLAVFISILLPPHLGRDALEEGAHLEERLAEGLDGFVHFALGHHGVEREAARAPDDAVAKEPEADQPVQLRVHVAGDLAVPDVLVG